MLEDIKLLKSLKPGGFVIGALRADGSLDIKTIEEQLKETEGFPVTFHRAIDMCRNPLEAIKTLADYGIENILTSGMHQNAIDGIENLKKFAEVADGRINIMAGSGVNPGNILQIAESGVDAFHFSAKKTIASKMTYRNEKINMGGDISVDEFAIYEAGTELINQAKQLIETI